MTKLILNDKEIDFYINKKKVPLVLDLNIALQLEKEYGDIFKAYEKIREVNFCIELITLIMNEAISKYNCTYSQSEKPVEREDVIDMLDISNINDIAIFIQAMQKIAFSQQNKKTKKKLTQAMKELLFKGLFWLRQLF